MCPVLSLTAIYSGWLITYDKSGRIVAPVTYYAYSERLTYKRPASQAAEPCRTWRNMKKTFSVACMLSVLMIAAIPASANILWLTENSQAPNCGGCSNILFQADDTGNPLLATVNNLSGTISVSQDAAFGDLLAPSNGQAKVTDNSTGTLTGLYMNFTGLSDVVTLLEFTIEPISGQNTDKAGYAVVTFVDNNGVSFNFGLGSVGQNRELFQAVDGQSIASVTLNFYKDAAFTQAGSVSSVEQIRVLTGEGGGGGTGGDAPEPVTVLLTGSALMGLALIVKRKRRA
jgi:hypothetical protein